MRPDRQGLLDASFTNRRRNPRSTEVTHATVRRTRRLHGYATFDPSFACRCNRDRAVRCCRGGDRVAATNPTAPAAATDATDATHTARAAGASVATNDDNDACTTGSTHAGPDRKSTRL